MKSIFVPAFLVSILGSLPAWAGTNKSDPTTDGEALYKANCTRCHTAIHTYGPRSQRTMVNHMRVRANLTKDEADAIFIYMAGDSLQPGSAPGKAPVEKAMVKR